MKQLVKTSVLVFVFALVMVAVPSYTSAAPGNMLVVDDDGLNCHNAGYTTIADALADAGSGDTIKVCSGSYDGALVDKSVVIRGAGQAVISGGPAHPSGFIMGFRLLAGSGGTEISHLTFEVDFPVMNGDGVDNVVIAHNTLLNSLQGISNWTGSNWVITHNDIIDLRSACGGGIGILVGDLTGSEANNNEVSHNKITGTLHVDPNDCGGYNGTGIVLYADHRGARIGGAVENNRVVKNHVALVSDTPDVVDVHAIELTDTRDDETVRDVVDNAIGFNDLRGTASQIALTPENLDEFNDISRNLGDNRGHGLHPSAFH